MSRPIASFRSARHRAQPLALWVVSACLVLLLGVLGRPVEPAEPTDALQFLPADPGYSAFDRAGDPPPSLDAGRSQVAKRRIERFPLEVAAGTLLLLGLWYRLFNLIVRRPRSGYPTSAASRRSPVRLRRSGASRAPPAALPGIA